MAVKKRFCEHEWFGCIGAPGYVHRCKWGSGHLGGHRCMFCDEQEKED